MVDMADVYTMDMNSEHKMFASWPPNKHYDLGDFGTLSGKIFEKIGNIKTTTQFPKIRFNEILSSSPKSAITYASKNMVQYVFKPQGAIGNTVKGSLDIDFSGENAVFFYAGDTAIYSIDDKISVLDQMEDLYKKKKWKRSWVLITDITRAGTTTVYISGGDGASVSLDANVSGIPIPVVSGIPIPIGLGSAGIQFGIKSKKNIAYDITSEPGLTPLMTLYGIIEDWWNGVQVQPLAKQPTMMYDMLAYHEIGKDGNIYQVLDPTGNPLENKINLGKAIIAYAAELGRDAATDEAFVNQTPLSSYWP